MGVWAHKTNDALTANGTTTGFATVAANTEYKVGATAWLRSASAAAECVVESLSGSTLVGLRIKRFLTNPDSANPKELAEYGRSDLSGFTTADSARLFQEAGVVQNPLGE